MSKRAPVNTAREAQENPLGVLLDALVEDNPSDAIYKQEAAGQQSFVNSDTLPREMSANDKLALRTAGVVFGDPVPGDDLFVYVTLPEGWRRQGTSHDMHSDLLDEKGRKRASIFYKAAFYDRRADLNVTRRFSVRSDYEAAEGTIIMHACDGDEVVFTTTGAYKGEKYRDGYYEASKKATEQCEAWFEQNGFPKWRNAGMYWD